MKKSLIKAILCLGFSFLTSCGSDDSPSDNGISIDPNTISIETLNGTWTVAYDLSENDERIEIGEKQSIYDYAGCDNLLTEEYTPREQSFGFIGNKVYSKNHTTSVSYIYDNTKGGSDCVYPLKKEEYRDEIEYEVSDVVEVFVKENKIYYQLKIVSLYDKSDTDYIAFRLTFRDNEILYSYVDHLGFKGPINRDIRELDYTDYNVLKKTTNDVDLENFNNGEKGFFYNGKPVQLD